MENITTEKQYSIVSDFIPYDELRKYLTGKSIEVPTSCHSLNGEVRKGIGLFPEYKIPIGSLINDFIEHKNKCWLRRKWYHKRLTEIYVQMLNSLGVLHYGL